MKFVVNPFVLTYEISTPWYVTRNNCSKSFTLNVFRPQFYAIILVLFAMFFKILVVRNSSFFDFMIRISLTFEYLSNSSAGAVSVNRDLFSIRIFPAHIFHLPIVCAIFPHEWPWYFGTRNVIILICAEFKAYLISGINLAGSYFYFFVWYW